MKRGLSLVIVAIAATVAACSSSSSTGPKTQTPAQLASHFDSIYSSLLAGGSDSDTEAAEFVAFFVESPAAFGASPVSVPVTTGSGAETWSGYGFDYATASDSFFVAAIYPSTSLQNLFLVEWDYTSGTLAMYADGFVNHFAAFGPDSAATGAASVSTLGTGSCSLQTGLAADSLISAAFAGNTCTPITFSASASVTFQAALGFGSLTTVSFPATTFNGVRLFGGNAPGHATRIPSVAAARVERLLDLMHRVR
jgi:hypothetical protein